MDFGRPSVYSETENVAFFEKVTFLQYICLKSEIWDNCIYMTISFLSYVNDRRIYSVTSVVNTENSHAYKQH